MRPGRPSDSPWTSRTPSLSTPRRARAAIASAQRFWRKSASMRSVSVKDQARARIFEAGLKAAQARKRPSWPSTRTVSPASAPPLATAESKIQGWRRSNDRSRPSRRRTTFIPGLSTFAPTPDGQPGNPPVRCNTMRLNRGAFLLAALFGLALLFASIGVRAATPLVLEAEHQPQRLLRAGDAWLDGSGKLGVEDVAKEGDLGWKPITGTEIFPLARDKALWLRFTVRADATAFGDRWYLEVPHAAVDRVTLYTKLANGTWRGATAGDLLPVSQWPVPHRHPLLPLADAGSSQTYYVKVENSHSFSAPLQFVSESYQSLGEQQIALMLGIYFGLAALAFVMAVLSATSLKDLGFALY